MRSRVVLLLILLGAVGCAREASSQSADDARPEDSVLVAARSAIAEGRPWRASRLLQPVLDDSLRRTPAAARLAARAAAGWRGWQEVRRLLAPAGADDLAADGGEGHLLLARAALGLRDDGDAARHARDARAAAADDRARAMRDVVLARALDRLDDLDSAAAAYGRAAEGLPAIGDWLRLRAAAVTRDSAARDALLQAVADPAARRRIPRVRAAAWARAGDTARAVAAHAAAGDAIAAFRLRAARRDTLLAAELVAYVRARSGSGAARDAIALLDGLGGRLRPADELEVARSASRSGPLPRAVSGFAAAFRAGLGTSGDRFEHASLLARLGRHEEAIASFRRVRSPRALAVSAQYRVARSLVRLGRAAEGQEALRAMIRRHPADTATAIARYLLADLATDDGRDADARAMFRSIAERFPRHRLAANAAFRAAIIALAAGEAAAAAAELDALARAGGGDEALAARYWAGRAHAALGDTAAAGLRWREVLARDSASYYADASARRLGIEPWHPAPADDPDPAGTPMAAAAAAASLLDSLGMDDEALLERQRAVDVAGRGADSLLLAAAALHRHGYATDAIRAARRAQVAGAPRTAALFRLLYPLDHADALRAEAARQGVEPALVAALIRQESLYDPAATSVAGARGLMQVMPDLGRQLARAHGYPLWDPVLLWQPDVSLELGTDHLRELLGRYGSLVETLAAYNAGAQRVTRWKAKPGTDDPELLVERIPYVETRDYVRIIQRNLSVYRALYAW